MSEIERVAYVDGDFVPQSRASVPIEDRGMLFADAVYEVVLVAGGRLVDLEAHMKRMQRSLSELHFPPLEISEIAAILARLVAANSIADGMVHVQVSRGEAPRVFLPSATLQPKVYAFARPLTLAANISGMKPISVMTRPDFRWGRCDIKTTALVPAVLALIEARQAGFDQVWFVDDKGAVTEGSASNAWIVAQGTLFTREAGPKVLAGVTRMRLIAIARELQMKVVERAFSVAEARQADEAFLTSATALITPIGQIDEQKLSAPGETSARLYEAYLRFCTKH